MNKLAICQGELANEAKINSQIKKQMEQMISNNVKFRI